MTKRSILIKVTNREAEDVAFTTRDARSHDRYGRGAWVMTAKRLAQRGYDRQQIEAVLRSKIMRWAGDASGKTKPTSADVLTYLDDPRNGGAAEIERITQDTFGDKRLHPVARGLAGLLNDTPKTGADLAGFCEGEDIADLIDLARKVKALPTTYGREAANILDRIERRAK